MRELLRAKIHKATVTEAELDYIGSITIDQTLLEKTDLWSGEKVLVCDMTNGNRLETYIIPGERDKGQICMNGAAAHLIKPGDNIIIMAFTWSADPVTPKIILVDDANRFVRYLTYV